MKLSLIGMSGVGKTYWAKQLESLGFKRFSCDDIIEAKLGKDLQKLTKAKIPQKLLALEHKKIKHTGKIAANKEAVEEKILEFVKDKYF